MALLVRFTSEFGSLDDVNAVFWPRVRIREPYPCPLKKGGLGYGSLLMWTQSYQIAEVSCF